MSAKRRVSAPKLTEAQRRALEIAVGSEMIGFGVGHYHDKVHERTALALHARG